MGVNAVERDNLLNYSDLPDSFVQNQERTVRMRNFARAVGQAMAFKNENGEARRKTEKVAALDALWEKGTDGLESSQLMRLYSAYRDLNAFDKMIDLYREAKNSDFREAPMVREQLAVAYRKVERKNVSSVADKVFDYRVSMSISQDLIRDGYGNGASYENLGRIRRYLADKTVSSDKQEEELRKTDFLKASVLAFETGFAETLESSVGIQAVHANIVLGRKGRAKETAKVVYLSALRDGAEESNDYFCISAALQAACIAGESRDVIKHLYNRLENSISYTWEIEDIRRDIDKISKEMPSPEIIEVQQKLAVTAAMMLPISVFENGVAKKTDVVVLSPLARDGERHMTEDPKLKALLDKSYNYRGCGSSFRGANRVDGNMAFGGQLPDHAVSRKDLRLFTGLVKMSPAQLGVKPVPGIDMDKPLTEIKDPELFMAVTDRFIRQAFSTENFGNSGLHMENNAFDKDPKTGESLYDSTVKSFLRSAGKIIGEKDPFVDTRTNISAIFALGMGDCRHHAQVKQIMFDMWQKVQMDKCLKQMYDKVLSEKALTPDIAPRQEFFSILDTELRSADVRVELPIQMQQWVNDNGESSDWLYKPLKTESGKYIVDETGKNHALEEHTLCWLVKKNREGELTAFGLRDAFYQQLHYSWGNMDVDVSKIQVDDKGNPKIPAGFIPGEKTSTGQPVEVFQSPTVYNHGKRDSFIKDSIGRDVCLVGVPLAGFATPSDFLKMIKDREGMNQVMENVRTQDAVHSKIVVQRLHAVERKPKEGSDGENKNQVSLNDPKAMHALRMSAAMQSRAGLHKNIKACGGAFPRGGGMDASQISLAMRQKREKGKV